MLVLRLQNYNQNDSMAVHLYGALSTFNLKPFKERIAEIIWRLDLISW